MEGIVECSIFPSISSHAVAAVIGNAAIEGIFKGIGESPDNFELLCVGVRIVNDDVGLRLASNADLHFRLFPLGMCDRLESGLALGVGRIGVVLRQKLILLLGDGDVILLPNLIAYLHHPLKLASTLQILLDGPGWRISGSHFLVIVGADTGVHLLIQQIHGKLLGLGIEGRSLSFGAELLELLCLLELSQHLTVELPTSPTRTFPTHRNTLLTVLPVHLLYPLIHRLLSLPALPSQLLPTQWQRFDERSTRIGPWLD